MKTVARRTAPAYIPQRNMKTFQKTVYTKYCCVYNLGYKKAIISSFVQLSKNKIIILHNFVKTNHAFFGDIAKYNIDVYVF